jgi:hypothetical protein
MPSWLHKAWEEETEVYRRLGAHLGFQNVCMRAMNFLVLEALLGEVDLKRKQGRCILP